MGLICYGASCRLCFSKKFIYFLLAPHQISQAELQRACRRVGHPCVFGKFSAWIQRKDQAPVKLKKDNRSCSLRFRSFELSSDNSFCRKTKAVTIERERFLEIINGQGDDVQLRFMASSPSP